MTILQHAEQALQAAIPEAGFHLTHTVDCGTRTARTGETCAGCMVAAAVDVYRVMVVTDAYGDLVDVEIHSMGSSAVRMETFVEVPLSGVVRAVQDLYALRDWWEQRRAGRQGDSDD